MSKFIYLTILILIAAIGIEYYINSKAEILTKKAAEWGKQNTLKLDKSAKREEFKITFDEAEWKSLQSKLDSTRYFNKLDNVPDFSYGFNPEYAKELVTYWSKSFDWKKQIDRLNKYQQYRITINNTVIHYIYHETNRNSKSQKPSINLMLVDGWPGCSFSFHKMIEKIETEFKDVSFKIIVPSIPGYGYSTPLNRVVDLVDTAILFDAIMRYENAEEYFVHGEDWGSGLATTLGLLFPGRVRGIHITLPFFASELSSIFNFGSYLLGQVIPSTYFSQKEIELNVPQRYSLSNRLWTVWFAFGYFHLQATKPDTVAHGLTDSPVGLLAYVLEKYSSWTLNYEKDILGKRDGGLGKFEKDDLLSIITIYWMTNSIGSSVRYYKANVGDVFTESSFKNQLFSTKLPTQVRIGIQQMDNELMMTPARVVQTLYPNLVQFEIVENGGHFAGFEKPLESAKNFGRFVLNSL